MSDVPVPEKRPANLTLQTLICMDFAKGGYARTAQCVEYPWLYMHVQCETRKHDPRRFFTIKGLIGEEYDTPDAAWAAKVAQEKGSEIPGP